MAEIKDKLVTVESLSAVHEYNAGKYMTKVNPTGSGTMMIDGNASFLNGVSVGSDVVSYIGEDITEINSNNTHLNSANTEINSDNVYIYANNEEFGDAGAITRNGSIIVQPDYISLHAQSENDTESSFAELTAQNGIINLSSSMGTEVNGNFSVENMYIEGTVRPQRAMISESGKTDLLLQTTFERMENNSVKTICLAQSVQDSLPVGGTWFVTIYKTNDSYGTVTAVRYNAGNSSSPYECKRSICDGVWYSWNNVSIPVETGIWTAKINSGTISYQNCTYQKIGNMCTISFYIHGTGSKESDVPLFINGAPYYPNQSAKWFGGGGHIQGLWDAANNSYTFTGFIIQSDDKRIFGRTKQIDGVENGYIRTKNDGKEFYLSGTITYPIDDSIHDIVEQ